MKSDWKSIFYTWNKNKSVCPLYERVVQLVGCWGYQGEMREREKQEKLQGRQRWGEQDVANVRYIVEREREKWTKRIPHAIICSLSAPSSVLHFDSSLFPRLTLRFINVSKKKKENKVQTIFLKIISHHDLITVLRDMAWKIGMGA